MWNLQHIYGKAASRTTSNQKMGQYIPFPCSIYECRATLVSGRGKKLRRERGGKKEKCDSEVFRSKQK